MRLHWLQFQKSLPSYQLLGLLIADGFSVVLTTPLVMKTKYEVFLQWNTNFFSWESSVSPTFWILPKLYELCESCRRSSLETCNKRVLSTGEPCTCEYVTLLLSFHRGTLSISTYLKTFSLPFPCPSYLDDYLGLPSLADSLRWL